MNYIDAEIIKGTKKYKISNNELTGTSLEVLSFIIGGISKNSYRTEIEGRGVVNYGYDYMTRKITLIIQAKADYGHDVAHLRDCINELFDGQYYIREMRNNYNTVQYETIGSKAGDMALISSEYVDGKQYFVESLSEIAIDDQKHINEFSIELTTVDLPFAESRYTTLDLQNNRYSNDPPIFGMTDNINQDMLNYKFATYEFDVWNAGNVAVEPGTMYLKISSPVLSIPEKMTITNATTLQSMVITNPISGGKFELNGMSIKINNVNILRNTNYNFIKLAPGKNTIRITGASYNEISVDFKFYYK